MYRLLLFSPYFYNFVPFQVQLLDELRRNLGMSYVFVSHDLSVIWLLCDRVMVMYLDKIVESGTAEEVFRQPGARTSSLRL